MARAVESTDASKVKPSKEEKTDEASKEATDVKEENVQQEDPDATEPQDGESPPKRKRRHRNGLGEFDFAL